MSIVVEAVSKRFKDFQALRDVSFEVSDGGLTSVLGPSGCGKSTLLRVIAGLERADSGRVVILGQDMTTMSPQARGVGFVFQHYAAFKHLTVRANIAFGLQIRKRPKQEIKQRVDQLLDLVQLNGYADRYPTQLSGGQRQRMALARALAVEPKVLLLDEPFGALDAQVRHELRGWLRELHLRVRLTTLLVTHDQEEAMEVSDRIVVMNKGRVEQVGSPVELYDEPANEFVMGFLGSTNRIGSTFVRPHDVSLNNKPGSGSLPGIVRRVIFLGSEVRADVKTHDDQSVRVQLSRQQAQSIELHTGQAVHLGLRATKTFADRNIPDQVAAA